MFFVIIRAFCAISSNRGAAAGDNNAAKSSGERFSFSKAYRTSDFV